MIDRLLRMVRRPSVKRERAVLGPQNMTRRGGTLLMKVFFNPGRADCSARLGSNTSSRCIRDCTLGGSQGHWYSVLMRRTASRKSLPKIRMLNRSEGLALLDRQARAELGVSGQTFVRRWKAGRYASR